MKLALKYYFGGRINTVFNKYDNIGKSSHTMLTFVCIHSKPFGNSQFGKWPLSRDSDSGEVYFSRL
jgi:hypothetical protein